MRVLVAGIGQSNFLDQLYSSIQDSSKKDYVFDVVSLKSLDDTELKQSSKSIYQNHYPFPKFDFFENTSLLLTVEFYRYIFQVFRFSGSLKKTKQYFRYYFQNHSLLRSLKNKPTLVHIHFVTPENLVLLHLLPKDTSIVLSFWGSDLMRKAGVFNYYFVQKALNRCDRITIQTNELKESLLSKFGRSLNKKVDLVKFPPDQEVYSLITEFTSDRLSTRKTFAEVYNLDIGKKWLVLGHNGHKANQHIGILDALSRLDSLTDDFELIIPFGYGGNDRYKANLLESIKGSGVKKLHFIEEFLGPEANAKLKASSDIYIHLPVSDALSATMTEFLYAGCQVITGDWLPYSTLRNWGMQYFSISSLDQLKNMLVKVSELTVNDQTVQNNKLIIEKFLFQVPAAKSWLNVYAEIEAN